MHLAVNKSVISYYPYKEVSCDFVCGCLAFVWLVFGFAFFFTLAGILAG